MGMSAGTARWSLGTAQEPHRPLSKTPYLYDWNRRNRRDHTNKQVKLGKRITTAYRQPGNPQAHWGLTLVLCGSAVRAVLPLIYMGFRAVLLCGSLRFVRFWAGFESSQPFYGNWVLPPTPTLAGVAERGACASAIFFRSGESQW